MAIIEAAVEETRAATPADILAEVRRLGWRACEIPASPTGLKQVGQIAIRSSSALAVRV
jgi:hypothetical protein